MARCGLLHIPASSPDFFDLHRAPRPTHLQTVSPLQERTVNKPLSGQRLRATSTLWFGVLVGCVGQVGAPGSGTASFDVGIPVAGGPGAPGSQRGGATASGPSAAAGSVATAPNASAPSRSACSSATGPSRSPLRRLTRFEFNNSVRDLLGDDTAPARAFPSEELGNGFGNDADTQSVSSLLAEQYSKVAEGIALRATETPAGLARLDPCTMSLAAANEEACARDILDKLSTRAYRRPVLATESEELVALFSAARADAEFNVALATPIEAILQAPDFLYRIELGEPDSSGRLRPSGSEMASRLSFLFWGTMPDATLQAAADSGELSSSEGVLSHARRMLDDPRARTVTRFFFDNLLPIASLSQLVRDPTMYPEWTPEIGELMHEETQSFIEHEIWSGSGTWPGMLTAPYTFVNEALAKYYGMPAVQGATFQKVAVDPNQRLGLLTQGALMAGTTTSNFTNPVIRGAFVAKHLMCRPLRLPSDPNILAQVKPPDPYSGKTARERYSAHSRDAVCATCHQQMDPIGLTFESFDAVGHFRTTENGETIDTSGGLPGTQISVQDALELVQAVAAEEETQACFVSHWLDFAYGRTLKQSDASDACLKEQLYSSFKASGYSIKQLLLDLTQTDAFLYLPGQ